MTPATHAAFGAVASSRCRNLGLALAVSFASHFLLDAVYHFEAFYALSVLGRWDFERTRLGLFAGLAVLSVPVVLWLLRRHRAVGIFACYGLAMSLLSFFSGRWTRLGCAILITALWYASTHVPQVHRWVLCGFFACLPDLIRPWIPPVNWLHEWFHYDPALDLGDWVSLLVTGRWRIYINERIFDPYYRIGYILEVLLEGAILFGCLYWLARGPRQDSSCLSDIS